MSSKKGSKKIDASVKSTAASTPEKTELAAPEHQVSEEPRHLSYEKEQSLEAKQNQERTINAQFESARSLLPVAKITILAGICVLAFLCRIFSVIRFESVIHEFDPWFNYRTTKFLTAKGWYDFWNWYDSESWYPLGRVIGGTIYPGLMGTAASIKWSLDALALPMDIRNICVFLAPGFAGLTAVSTYFFTKEATNKPGAGLMAALFISIVPSYISRSVAGSYDNEAVAIFALVNTFFLWIKAVNTGSILWSIACTLQYFYMVAAWGGYSFIINIIPIFVLAVIFANKFNYKIYIAYSVFYILGTMLAMTIPFVTFNAIKSSEHLASHAVFFAMNAFVVVEYMRKNLPEQQFAGLIKIGMTLSLITVAFGFVYLTFSGNTKWSGRSMTLLDPTYAKKYIPIIASVSEHQPTAWTNYFFDMGYLVIFLPMGYYFCLIEDVTYGKLFIGIYGVLATYFSCVMIRLMLTLAPVVCIIAAIGLNEAMEKAGESIRQGIVTLSWDVSDVSSPETKSTVKKQKENQGQKKSAGSSDEKDDSSKQRRRSLLPLLPAVGIFIILISTLQHQIYHSTILAADAYSSPSIIMAHKMQDGSRLIIDDYREAYYWLKQNTPADSKIMSWWDYGYQITGMANRTVLVDNNTWNNTHIATVGKAFASTEEEGYHIARFLGADYVLVIFGGMTNFSGDDISKFLWMIRIAAGVFSQVKEENFYNNGNYRVDNQATPTMLNSLMYRLCYFRFGEMYTRHGEDSGYDSVRQAVIGKRFFNLNFFEEAYTSERWLVRIYRVLPLTEMVPGLTTSQHMPATLPIPVIPKLNKPLI